VSATWAIRFGTYTKGASRISSPPPAENVKGAISAARFSPTASFATVRCLLSLASETWNTFSHLKEGIIVTGVL